MDRTRKLLLALAAAAVAATLLALRGWIAPATARWVLLALLGSPQPEIVHRTVLE